MKTLLCFAVSLCLAGIQIADASPPTPCDPGTVSANGNTPCQQCEKGHYAPAAGLTQCTKCPTGTKQPLKGQSQCVRCPPGQYQDRDGQRTCTLCDRGYYQTAAGQDRCRPCISGFYQPARGQSSCRACRKGTYNPFDGQTECTQCPTGTTTRYPQRVLLVECVPINGAGDEPHILISNSGEKLCFNFHGKDDQVFDLISDNENEIYVTGETFEIQVPGKLKPLSYFLTIGIESPEHSLHFGGDNYTVDGKTYLYTDEIQMADLVVEPAGLPHGYQVDLSNGAAFIITKKSNDMVGVYLGVHALGTDGLSKSSGGIIGQFLHTEFRPELAENGDSAMMIFGDEHPSVPVHLTTRLSSATGRHLECWMYQEMPNKLIGNPEDYLV